MRRQIVAGIWALALVPMGEAHKRRRKRKGHALLARKRGAASVLSLAWTEPNFTVIVDNKEVIEQD